jgi:hypothetical protein
MVLSEAFEAINPNESYSHFIDFLDLAFTALILPLYLDANLFGHFSIHHNAHRPSRQIGGR